MAFALVAVCCIFLVLSSSTGGSPVLSSPVLSWWKVGGGGGSEDCGLNKLAFVCAGFPDRFQAGGVVLLSSGCHGDGEEGGPRFVSGFFRSGEQGRMETAAIAYGVQSDLAVGELPWECTGHSLQCAEFLLLRFVLWRSEPVTGVDVASPSSSIMSDKLCRFNGQGMSLDSSLVPCRGGETDGEFRSPAGWLLALHQGCSEEALGRSFMAAHSWLPSQTVERRPLQPFFVSDGFFRQTMQGENQPPGVVPLRRPCGSGAAGSRRLTPSGSSLAERRLAAPSSTARWRRS